MDCPTFFACLLQHLLYRRRPALALFRSRLAHLLFPRPCVNTTRYVKVRKMKGAFHTMNKFSTDVTSSALIGEGWVPRADLDTLRDRLTKVTERLGNGVPAIVKIMSTREAPPTYNITNKFTVGFQVYTSVLLHS